MYMDLPPILLFFFLSSGIYFTLYFHFYLAKKALFSLLTEQLFWILASSLVATPPISLWCKCHFPASLLQSAFLRFFCMETCRLSSLPFIPTLSSPKLLAYRDHLAG